MFTKFQQKKTKFTLVYRQRKWKATVQKWGITLMCAATLVVLMVANVHPFLSVNSPTKADVLVVEGWLLDYALQQAITEFESGSYRLLVTTGGPLERGSHLAKYNNYAELAAATLKALGLEKEKIVAISTPSVIKNRTYASAVAVQQWLSNSNLQLKAINLFSSDVHARRSWLIYKQVLAPKIKVGVIAAEQQSYDANKWWSSSAGVRSVIDELIAYIYVRFVSLTA